MSRVCSVSMLEWTLTGAGVAVVDYLKLAYQQMN